MNAVVRGDVHSIRIGPYTNIQDNCVVHVFKDKHPTVLADHVTVGHSVTLHGCRIDSYCLIGMGAIVLNDAHVGEECIVAAGTADPGGHGGAAAQPGHGRAREVPPADHGRGARRACASTRRTTTTTRRRTWPETAATQS